MNDDAFYNRVGGERIEARQFDELVGLARGLCADGVINQAEVKFLQKWLAANSGIVGQPLITTLYRRIDEVLSDGAASADECSELLATLSAFSDTDFELGEVLKPSRLPLCSPPPNVSIQGASFCFTGKFSFGDRKKCEDAVLERGGRSISTVTQQTDYLVVGGYATESWKHSNMGGKILRAVEIREHGHPIRLVSEDHWVAAVRATPVIPEGDVLKQMATEALDDSISGMVVVFTGQLSALTRSEAQEQAEALGAKTSGAVSPNTGLVVAGPGAGAKLKRASELGIRVIDEAEWAAIVQAAG